MKLQSKINLQQNKASVSAAQFMMRKNSVALQDMRPRSILQKKESNSDTSQALSEMVIHQRTNNTGLPNNLKSGIENLSGHSLNDVKVHYNSSQPAQLNAHAYAQGNQIHIAPGQEKHLPHEAWHVVQQKQGRVQPTMQMKGKVNVNDDVSLEKEADVMGAKAMQLKIPSNGMLPLQKKIFNGHQHTTSVTQRAATKINYETGDFTYTDEEDEEQEQEVGVKMTAHLNPAQPREGTSPSGMDGLMDALGRTYSNQRMIRGHLLNGNLGGLGIPDNLFPITNRANRLHETQVENHVKQEIEDNNEVDYEVTVINADMSEDDADATFHCEVWDNNGTKIVDKEINSVPSANRKNSAHVNDNQEDDADNRDGGRSYRNADLPNGWGERGSGRRGEIGYEQIGKSNKYVLRDNTNNSVNATINA